MYSGLVHVLGYCEPCSYHALGCARTIRTARVLFSGVRSGFLHSGQWTLVCSQRSMHRRWTPSAVRDRISLRAEPSPVHCSAAQLTRAADSPCAEQCGADRTSQSL